MKRVEYWERDNETQRMPEEQQNAIQSDNNSNALIIANKRPKVSEIAHGNPMKIPPGIRTMKKVRRHILISGPIMKRPPQ